MVDGVKISYDGLWKILIDKKMRKQDLRIKAGLTNELISKLGKSESVHLDALIKICKALDCNLNDILEVEIIKESE